MEVAKFSQQSFHDSVDVLLECVNLAGPVVFLEILDHLLHVVLQVDHVVLLGSEPRLGEPVVEDNVDATDGSCGISALVSIGTISGGIGARQLDLSLCPGLVLGRLY